MLLCCHITHYHYSKHHRILHELIWKMEVNKIYIVFKYIYSVDVDDDYNNNNNSISHLLTCYFHSTWPIIKQVKNIHN